MNDVPSKDAAPPPDQQPKVTTGDKTVTYTFPVKVILVGALTKEDFSAIEDRIWTDINDAMSGSS